MNTRFCPETHAWLTGLNDPAAPPAPPPDLSQHVAGCARCQGAVQLLATELLHAPLDVEQTTCDQCQEDLAAYIDVERDDGVEAAVAAYPHVWWHLWTCPDCAEAYQMIVTLQEAEAAEDLPPIPLSSLISVPPPRQPRPRIGILTLPRVWLVQSLVPQYGIGWGEGDQDTVLHESEDGGYQITVSVRKQSGQWTVVLTIDPPLVGDAIVTLGAETFRASIDPQGIAAIGPIPADLLKSPTGPDMAIRIEPTVS